MMQDLARTHVRAVLNGLAHQNRRTAEKVKEIEAAGGRIVTGRLRGEDGWQVIDWRTGRILATDADHPTPYDAIRAIPGDTWHIDYVWESVDRSGPEPPDGLPTSLADALEDWVNSAQTTDADIAAVADEDPEEVEACRSDPLYGWTPTGVDDRTRVRLRC